jgi:hypothetical protein
MQRNLEQDLSSYPCKLSNNEDKKRFELLGQDNSDSKTWHAVKETTNCSHLT